MLPLVTRVEEVEQAREIVMEEAGPPARRASGPRDRCRSAS